VTDFIANDLQCDKKKDACGQCIRAQLTCPGYHDPQKLVFRDQTTAVLKKVFQQGEGSIGPALYEPLEGQAKNLFISRHVFGDFPIFNYAKAFYPLKPLEHSHVIAAIRAVCMSYLANEVQSTSIRENARKKYSSALILTNKALQDTRIATQNTMLLTILLLNHYESLTEGPSRLDAEARHLEGALTLIKIRGKSQFENPLSIVMFMHLGSNILNNCLARKVGVPLDFLHLRSQVEEFIDVNDLGWQVSALMIKVVELQVNARSRTTTRLESALHLQGLRQELDLISDSLQSAHIEEPSVQSTTHLTSDMRQLRMFLSEPPNGHI
jgi:hypothetical protein